MRRYFTMSEVFIYRVILICRYLKFRVASGIYQIKQLHNIVYYSVNLLVLLSFLNFFTYQYLPKKTRLLVGLICPTSKRF